MKLHGNPSKSEFRGILSLAAIVFISLALPQLFASLKPRHLPATLEVIKISSDTAATRQPSIPVSSSGHRTRRTHPSPLNPSLSARRSDESSQSFTLRCTPFDPNTVPVEVLNSFGLPAFVVRNIDKYRAAGGRFKHVHDLTKIYGVDSALFALILPCMILDTVTRASVDQRREPFSLDINAADITAWMALPGIGEILATRIVRFRESLGGFLNPDQVAQTYGLPPETMAHIRPLLRQATAVRHLNLNTSSADELARHPYITRRQAEAIVNFRLHHGAFAQTADVLQVLSLDSIWFARMGPYLTCTGADVAATR